MSKRKFNVPKTRTLLSSGRRKTSDAALILSAIQRPITDKDVMQAINALKKERRNIRGEVLTRKDVEEFLLAVNKRAKERGLIPKGKIKWMPEASGEFLRKVHEKAKRRKLMPKKPKHKLN